MRNNLGIANAYNSAKKSDGTDAFWTVDWATEILLRNTELSEEVLEPACGEGWISEVLKKHGYKVTSSDINDWGYGKVQDFLSLERWDGDLVTNPPYKLAMQFIEHALNITSGRVCMLLRSDFWCSITRYDFMHNHMPSKVIYIARHLPIWQRDIKKFKHSGIIAHNWAIWEKNSTKTQFILEK